MSAGIIEYDFENKVVIVTGASSGIGATTAVEFAKHHACLVLCGRNEARLKEVDEKCKAAGANKTVVVIGDLTTSSTAEGIILLAIQHYKKIDVLINNAGMLSYGGIEETSMEDFDKVMNTNVRSVYQLTMLAVPHLIQSRGNIVNVSSMFGQRACPGVLAYNMSKAAIDHFTQCVALDLAGKGVRVNSVNPGIIGSELQRTGGMTEEAYKNLIERCKQTHPLGRHGEAEEVARAIVFLASSAASFITAVHLPVDGGRSACCPR